MPVEAAMVMLSADAGSFWLQVTYDDIHAPENPCFWCKSCYQKVHYDEAGKLLYDSFKQFQYLHE